MLKKKLITKSKDPPSEEVDTNSICRLNRSKRANVCDRSEASKRGSRARNKGANYERTIAKKFFTHLKIELVRTPMSGGFVKSSMVADQFRGDIVCVDSTKNFSLHVECKDQKKWELKKWLTQARSDCPNGKKPVVVFHENRGEDLILLKLEDFFDLVDREKIIQDKR